MQENRIALLLPRLSRYGGSEGFAWRLAECLTAAGHAVEYICARQESPAPAGVTVRRVGRFGLTRVEKMLWFALAAEQVRRKGRYALSIGLGKSLHQDILRIGGGPLPVFWEKSKRAWPEGLSQNWKMLRRRMAPSNTLTRIIERRALARTPRIVAVSHLVGDWIRQAYPFVEQERIQVIYNRPDLSRFQPAGPELRIRQKQAYGIDPTAVVVGTAATNFALKGTGFLIRALAQLPDNFHLLVAGGRDPHRLLRLAQEQGLAGARPFSGQGQRHARVLCRLRPVRLAHVLRRLFQCRTGSHGVRASGHFRQGQRQRLFFTARAGAGRPGGGTGPGCRVA